jgi:anti-sigma factor RsiW
MSEPEFQHELDDELLSAYVDGELTVEERAAVEARLASDPAARQLLHQLRSVSQSVQALPMEPVGRDLREQILRRAGALKPAVGTSDVMPKVTIFQTRRPWVWASLAVAAGLLIMVLQPGDERGKSLPAIAKHDGGTAVNRPLEESLRREASPPAPAATDPASIARNESAAAAMPPASVAATPPAMRAREGSLAASAPPSSAPVDVSQSLNGDSRYAIGELSESAPVSEAEQASLVVVHVVAKPEALQNKTFDKLLASNGITIETGQQRSGGAVLSDSARRLAADKETEQLAETSVEKSVSDQVELVLIDAPKPAVFSCLAGLKQDAENYVGVAVDEPAETVDRADAESPLKKKFASDLGQFNRGIVSQKQKDAFGDRYLYRESAGGGRSKSERGLARGSIAGENRKSNVNESEMKRLQSIAAENRGRAQRLSPADADGDRPVEPAARGGTARGPIATDSLAVRRAAPPASKPDSGEATDNLQVLFVISPDGEAATGASAEKPAQ